MLRTATARRALGKPGLLALLIAAVLATAPATRADDTSLPRSTDSYATTLSLLPSLSGRFVVWADDCHTNLGSWAKADGLDDGGQVVELVRAAGADSKLVLEWLSEQAFESGPSNVTVTLVNGSGTALASWELSHALAIHWSIGYFDAEASSPAVETLDLSHQGLSPVDPC